jgi:hypothetical protein
MKTLLVLSLLLLFTFKETIGQKLPSEPQRWPVIISVFSEAWAIPSTQLIKNPIHPGISIGTAYALKQKNRSSLHLGATLGYFYHKNFQHNVHAIVSLAYERRLFAGIHLGGSLGVGYSHSIYPTPVYSLKDGEYQRVTDWGKPAFMPAADLNFGYTFNRKREKLFTVFTKYQVLAEWPYAPENTFPVLPHTLFHAGLRFYPFK